MHIRAVLVSVSVLAIGVVSGVSCSTTKTFKTPGYSSFSAYKSSTAPIVAGCVSTELSRMSTRRKLAQLLMVGVKDTADAREAVNREHVGGIFVGSWTDGAILTSGVAKTLSSGRVPTMVSVDQEGGRVSRLKTLGIDFPSARELAKTKSLSEVRHMAFEASKRMKAIGITVVFAPDIDVSDQPADSVIGDRSFSNNPSTVAQYGRAFAAGVRDAGILPVFKHFPGHGHGSGDSHTGTVKTPPLSDLVINDLEPFRVLLKMEDVGAMVGHLIVPGLTGSDIPASISPKAISMLRTGIGYNGPAFNGVIFTDDLLGMAAITDKYPIDQAVSMALTSGADVALWITTNKLTAVLDALEKNVASGNLSLDHIDASVTRILRAKHLKHC